MVVSVNIIKGSQINPGSTQDQLICVNICTYVCICLYSQYMSISVNICPISVHMFVSVCNSLYLSICLYLFICSYLCTSLRSSSQGSNSQQQSATVHKQSSSHGSHGCLFISVYTFISVHICLYQTFICTYMHIFVHICIYLFISAYICAYLCIYVYIQKLHFDGKKPNF